MRATASALSLGGALDGLALVPTRVCVLWRRRIDAEGDVLLLPALFVAVFRLLGELNEVKFLTFLLSTYGAEWFRWAKDLVVRPGEGDLRCWSLRCCECLLGDGELRRYPGDFERDGVVARGRCQVGVLLSRSCEAQLSVGMFPWSTSPRCAVRNGFSLIECPPLRPGVRLSA